MSTIFTIENIFQAYEDCRRSKKNTTSALGFEVDREKNLFGLLYDLKNNTYQVSPHICFVITKPTPREIFAANFRDRVVHHLLCSEIESCFEVDFLPHSYANRKYQGTHRAVTRLERNMQSTLNGFYVQLDIENFFRSIDKDILFGLLENKIRTIDKPVWWKREVLDLARVVVFHDPTIDYEFRGNPENRNLIPYNKSLFSSKGAGLPIGNLTSQFFANVYLDSLDKFVVRELGLTKYVRYVDDFVIIHKCRKRLSGAARQIDRFLIKNLALKLHPKKTKLQQIDKGVDFLGYIVKPKYRLVRRKVVARAKLAFVNMQTQAQSEFGDEDKERQLAVVNSYYGHFRHGASSRLRSSLFNKYLSVAGFLQDKDGKITIKKVSKE